jgi:hypothetical protein
MADIFLTLKQIENLFWNVTTQMLGLDPALPANASKVRIAWPTDGAPSWKITDDVVFIRIADADDPINVLRDTDMTVLNADNANQATAYTRVVSVYFVCYGPNSFDNAFMIRNNLYKQKYRDLLNVKSFYLIPQIGSPARRPELLSGQWWERSDLSANFNELIQFNETVPYIKSAVIPIATDDTTETIEVTPESSDTGVHIIPN